MFLDESAFDVEDDYPSRGINYNSRQNNSYNSNNNNNSNNGQKNNDLAIVLDDDMEDLSISGLGSAGGIGTSSASRARFLAQQRELNLKKQQQKIAQSGMIRSSVESVPDTSGQFTPSVRQFSAPKAPREVESDFSRHQAQSRSPAAPFSPVNEKVTNKSKKVPFEEEDYEAPKSRSDKRAQDRYDERETRRQSSRGGDYDDDRRNKGRREGGNGKSKGNEGWVEDDRDDYERRNGGKGSSSRRKDDYDDDYGRSSRNGGRGDRVESRRGESDRRRPKDGSSDEEERYSRNNRNERRSRSPPSSRSNRRRDEYDDRDRDRDRDDDRRRDKGRDDYRDDRRNGKNGNERSKRRDDYDDDYGRTNRNDKDRDRDRERNDRDKNGGDRRQKSDIEEDGDRGKNRNPTSGRGGREWESGDEDSEAPEKWAAAGRSEREAGPMVGPGARGGGERNTGPPPSMPQVELDLSDMTRFLMRPLPRGAGIVQCHIVRNKGGTNKLYPIYSLYLKDNDRFLMCSKKRPNNKTSNYLISKKENDLARDSPNYLGKLRSNFVGTEFQVFDNGSSPDDEDKESTNNETRRELGAITYAPNVLGSRGPRKMQAVIPSVDESNAIVSWRQSKGSEGEMLQRIKDRNFKDLCYFINKPPRWNEQVGAYVLNFSGRVTMASVKNFQLVDPDEQNAIVLQFGRVGKDQFTMDMQWPMSPFQAFAITLSSFDSKIACD